MIRNFLIIAYIFLGVICSQVNAANKNLLIILTGSSELKLVGEETYKTGYWLEEFSVPYQLFEQSGFQITVATPKGNRPTVDHGSAGIGENGKPLYWKSIDELNEALAIKKRVLDEGPIMALAKLTDKELVKFDAVFFPGGHGPMSDMLKDTHVSRVLKYFHKRNKLTALVCHAPAVLISTSGKSFPYKGYKVTAFTDAEEAQTPVGPKLITTPQKLLSGAGAVFVDGQPWQPHVVEDRELITGQNPASSKLIAETLVKRLLSH